MPIVARANVLFRLLKPYGISYPLLLACSQSLMDEQYQYHAGGLTSVVISRCQIFCDIIFEPLVRLLGYGTGYLEVALFI